MSLLGAKGRTQPLSNNSLRLNWPINISGACLLSNKTGIVSRYSLRGMVVHLTIICGYSLLNSTTESLYKEATSWEKFITSMFTVSAFTSLVASATGVGVAGLGVGVGAGAGLQLTSQESNKKRTTLLLRGKNFIVLPPIILHYMVYFRKRFS